jgi:hypothetical protein
MLGHLIPVNCIIEAECRVCLKSTDYWIIIGLNYFAPLGVKTGIIYLINGKLKGVNQTKQCIGTRQLGSLVTYDRELYNSDHLYRKIPWED